MLITEIGAVLPSKANQELKSGASRCIGFIGFLIDEQFEEFITCIADKCKNSKREEERASLLQSLHESLINHVNANKCVRETAVKNLLEFTKAHLDINDSPLELIPLLDICQLMAKYYSLSFRPHLHDICDYVIGWLLDQTQPKYVENKCREIIHCFGPIFVSDIQEAVIFLQSLIDDCFYIVDQLENPPEDLKSRDKLFAAIPMLKLINKMAENIDSKLQVVAKSSEHSVCQFYTKIGDVLLLMHSVSGDDRLLLALTGLLQRGISYRPIGKPATISLLRLFVQVLNRAKQPQKSELICLLVGQESCLVSHPLLADKEVCLAITATYSKLLDLRDLSNLQIVYSKIAREIVERFTQLQESVRGVLSSECKSKEMFIIALLASMRTLSTAKNSIIVMRGLDPSLFSLLFEVVPLKEGWLITYFPACHYSLLCLAKTFSETHDYFLANSEMFRQVQDSSATFTLDAPTKGYFTKIVYLLTNLLQQSHNLSVESQSTMLKWLDRMVKALGHMPEPLIYSNYQVVELQKALLILFVDNTFAKTNELAKLLLIILNGLKCFDVLSGDQSDKNFMKTWITKMIHKAGKWTSEEFSSIWSHLPANLELRVCTDGILNNLAEVEQQALGSSSMAAFQFQILTDFLLNKTAPSLMLNNYTKWMTTSTSALYTSLKEDIGNRTAKQLDLVAISQQWRFIVSQYALFCVENRMKTPIGKALETFTKLKVNEIREIISMLTSRSPSDAYKECVQCGEEIKLQPPKPAQLEEDEEGANSLERSEVKHKLTPNEEFLRVRLLVQMVDSLDKLMVFVWHAGSSFSIADISTGSSQFFQTNQASCQGWITRIVRMGGFLFADFQQKFEAEDNPLKLDSTSLSAICWVVRALVKLAAPQAIRGIQRWSEKVFSQSYSLEWIPGAELLAAGRVEPALQAFSKFLIGAEKQMEYQVLSTVEELSLECMNVLRNTRVTRPFSISIFKSEKSADLDPFKKFQMESVLALSSWDSLNNIEVKKNARSSLPWELENRINELEINLLHLWTNSGNNKKLFNTRSELSFMSQEMTEINQTLLASGDEGVRHSLIREPAKLPPMRNGAVNMASFSSPDLDVPSLFSSDRNKNPLIQLLVGNMLSSWLARLNQPSAYSTSKLLCLDLAQLAWQLDSKELAEFYLQRSKPPVQIPNKQFFPNPMAPSFPQPSSFINGSVRNQFGGFPPMAVPGKLSDADFECILLSAKMKWQNSGEVGSRAHCFSELTDVVSIQIDQQQASTRNGPQEQNPQKLNGMVSKMCLRLGKWVQSVPETCSILYNKQVNCPRLFFDQILQSSEFLRDNCPGVSPNETLKAHKALADWAIQQLYCDISAAERQDFFSVTTQEETILNKLGFNTQSDQGTVILELIAQHTAVTDLKNSFKCCKQLVDLPVLLGAVSSPEFSQLWSQLKRRQRKFCRCETAINNQPTAKITFTCLQILKLLCEYTEWFAKVLDDNWLERVNPDLWKALIPQLFARLNHTNLVVRNTISRILIKIGEFSPHAICLPAIVNSQLSDSKGIECVLEEEDELVVKTNLLDSDTGSQGTSQGNKDCSLLAKSSSLVVAALEKKHPELVKEATNFCTQLHQIHMLPEEKWLFVLNHVDHDLAKRLKQLEGENAKVRKHPHLSEEEKLNVNKQKLESVMQMVNQLLTDLFYSTCTPPPGTTLEKRFQTNYMIQIKHALTNFQTNRLNPTAAWAPFKKLIEGLDQKANKKSSLCLYMHEMSPHLAYLSSTSIAIPGQEFKRGLDTVRIYKMNKMAYVLPTKTRPKKIGFKGSDGKDYTFLLKGQEDLHLDERVMQLLTTCNQLLSEEKWVRKGGGWPEYSCNSYSVTPLGPRWGLIEWVEGATPLFQIYRKWRANQAENEAKKKLEKKPSLRLERQIKRDFFNKLKTVFQQEKLSKEVLRNRQTPRDILSKELWMRSGDSYTWWRVTQRFARSTAVMSMVGSIVGLGDRHLDNVLVNLTNGKLIHVDYNVCFEKGRQLRIPETVPFRLTGNIVNALGLTQTEVGTYRESCEHVLNVLRSSKRVLLTMLNAFVYDPLVEWATPDQSFCSTSFNMGVVLAVYGSDKSMELSQQHLFQMFLAKLTELKKPWTDVGLRLQKAVRLSVVSLEQLLKHRQSLNSNTQDYELLDKAKAEAFSELKEAITEHHNIMLQFRPLLRVLASVDTGFASFLQLYKNKFSRPFVESHKLLEKEGDKVDLAGSIQLLSIVLSNVIKVHDTFLELQKPNYVLKEQDSSFQTKPHSTTTSKFKDIHANNIAYRIHRKLNGYEIIEQLGELSEKVQRKNSCSFVETEAMSSAEQVDFLIKKSSNVQNLALMYEGWTAWV
uniref:Non-specific serine/threonine protein kinase n=1 Tax=Ditylenchus dipsaci TaxID=166011 RepID=A0A915ESJ8_9BILA